MEPETNNNEPVQSPEASAASVETEETPTTGRATEEGESTDDNSQYQTYAILGYVIPFLFFLPLLDEKTKNVPYVRFHANQQLILLVVIFGVYILHSFLFSMLMMLGYYVAQILNLAILALAIMGIFNAYNGKMKELPFVGQFRLLK